MEVVYDQGAMKDLCQLRNELNEVKVFLDDQIEWCEKMTTKNVFRDNGDDMDYKFDAKGNVCQMVPLSEKNKDGDGDTQYRTVEFERQSQQTMEEEEDDEDEDEGVLGQANNEGGELRDTEEMEEE